MAALPEYGGLRSEERQFADGAVFVDATLGMGGHTEAVLRTLPHGGRVGAGQAALGFGALDVLAVEVPLVHGPGGVGKTALLRAVEDVARDAGARTARLDLRSIEPSPPATSPPG